MSKFLLVITIFVAVCIVAAICVCIYAFLHVKGKNALDGAKITGNHDYDEIPVSDKIIDRDKNRIFHFRGGILMS